MVVKTIIINGIEFIIEEIQDNNKDYHYVAYKKGESVESGQSAGSVDELIKDLREDYGE